MPTIPKRPCLHPGCGALTDRGRCDTHRPQHDRDQASAKPSQQADYRIRGRALQSIRAEHFKRFPLCVMCRAAGRVTQATELDHILALTNGGTDTADNRQGLCIPCHEVKTLADVGLREGSTIRGPRWRLAARAPELRERKQAFDALRFPSDLMPSRIPCVMVCGPPNGGKHPYVREHAGANDVVIDLDRITADLSGLPVWQAGATWLHKALAERNNQLRALATDTTHERAWFLINAPSPIERAQWAERLGATITLLAPPLAECVRRINAEPYHAGYTEQMIKAARDWWQQNSELIGHCPATAPWHA